MDSRPNLAWHRTEISYFPSKYWLNNAEKLNEARFSINFYFSINFITMIYQGQKCKEFKKVY